MADLPGDGPQPGPDDPAAGDDRAGGPQEREAALAACGARAAHVSAGSERLQAGCQARGRAGQDEGARGGAGARAPQAEALLAQGRPLPGDRAGHRPPGGAGVRPDRGAGLHGAGPQPGGRPGQADRQPLPPQRARHQPGPGGPRAREQRGAQGVAPAAHPEVPRRGAGPRVSPLRQAGRTAGDGGEGQARRGVERARQGAAHHGEPAPRRLDRQEVHEPGPPVPGPDPGGEHRPDEGCREVRVPSRLQVLDLRHLVDPSGGGAGDRRPVADDPDPGSHDREHQQADPHVAVAGPGTRAGGPRPRRSASTWTCRPPRSARS